MRVNHQEHLWNFPGGYFLGSFQEYLCTVHRETPVCYSPQLHQGVGKEQQMSLTSESLRAEEEHFSITMMLKL